MGMVDGRFTVDAAEPYEGQGPGRPRERNRLRDGVLQRLDDTPQSARGIAKGVRSNDRIVGRVLRDLETEGLVEHRRDGWARRNSSPLGDTGFVAPEVER
jgi:hypothetical protein